MAQDMDIEQFKHHVLSLASPENNMRVAAEQAVVALENNNLDRYVSLLVESMQVQVQESEMLCFLAFLLLKNLLKKKKVPHSHYENIFDTLVSVVAKIPRNIRATASQIMSSLIITQLQENDDTIFNKYMILLDKCDQNIVMALGASETLFEERDILLATCEENSARLKLVFDKLLHFLKKSELRSSELFLSLSAALAFTTEYLVDDAVRSFVIETMLASIESGVSFGYQVLTTCLSQIYDHLEPYLERLINSISKANNANTIDDSDREGRLVMLIEFWLEFCEFDAQRREEHEEFSKYEISAPVTYLGVFQRYGAQIVNDLVLLSLLPENAVDDDEDYGWHFSFMQCIIEISSSFDLDTSPYLDKISVARTRLLLSATSHFTSMHAKINAGTFTSGKHLVHLRLPPSYLVDALDSHSSTEIKDKLVAGAGEYIPLYDNQVQEKCIKFVIKPVQFPEEKRLGSFAEILRLKSVKNNSNEVVQSLVNQAMEFEEQRVQEWKCYQNIAQLYSVPDEALQSFIDNCLVYDTVDPMTLYHLLKPFKRDFFRYEETHERAIKNFWNNDQDFDDVLALLGLICQRMGSSISKVMYGEIMDELRSFSGKSYRVFDAMACIVPPEGTSHLTHLESIIDLFEKEMDVTDDVQVEYVIRGLTALFATFKHSAHEFLFVGQIKRVISALQPALELHSPSHETLRAYLTFIRELCALEQAPSILRADTVMNTVLKSASESSDRSTRSLAQSVSKLLAE